MTQAMKLLLIGATYREQTGEVGDKASKQAGASFY
jgi:hypothetical protein